MKDISIKILVIFSILLFILTSSVTASVKSIFLNTNNYEDDDIIPTISYIHGTVREYPDGTPVPDAIVEFRKSVSLPWKSTRSDENGDYYLEVRNMLFFPKYYVIWAVSTGLQMLPTYIEVNNRRNFDVTKDLWIAPSGSGRIHGYITDRDNRPINNAEVELLIYPYETTFETFFTTSDGYYSFTSLNVDIYKIFVEKIGFRPPHIPPGEIYLGRDGNFDIVYNFEMIKSIRFKGFVNSFLYNYIVLR